MGMGGGHSWGVSRGAWHLFSLLVLDDCDNAFLMMIWSTTVYGTFVQP